MSKKWRKTAKAKSHKKDDISRLIDMLNGKITENTGRKGTKDEILEFGYMLGSMLKRKREGFTTCDITVSIHHLTAIGADPETNKYKPGDTVRLYLDGMTENELIKGGDAE